MGTIAPANEWVITLFFLAVLVIASEGAFWLGRHFAPHVDDNSRGQFGAVQAAVLGLLGLFLAFSFSLAAERYDTRRELVLKEANAIGTAYLRTDLLASPAGSEVRDLLRRYVDARLEFYEARVDLARVDASIQLAQRIQSQAWSVVVEQAKRDPHEITVGLMLQALNDVIDVSEERVIALENHVPSLVLVLLIIVGSAALGMVGYLFGLLSKPRRGTLLVLSLLVASIFFIIVNRPRRGYVRISQQSMLDLKASFGGQGDVERR